MSDTEYMRRMIDIEIHKINEGLLLGLYETRVGHFNSGNGYFRAAREMLENIINYISNETLAKDVRSVKTIEVKSLCSNCNLSLVCGIHKEAKSILGASVAEMNFSCSMFESKMSGEVEK